MPRDLVKNASNPNPPNLLINGGFDFWQRGITGFVPAFTGYPYTADRWQAENGGGAGGTRLAERNTDLPSVIRSGFSLRLSISAASGSTTESLYQKVEAAGIAPYIGRQMTFSVWFKTPTSTSSVTARVYVPVSATPNVWNADPGDNDTSIITSTVSNVLNTWTRLSVTFTVPSTAINGIMVRLGHATTLTGASECLVAGAMLTEGVVPPANFYRAGANMQAELAMCQRYFYAPYFGSPGNNGYLGVGMNLDGTLSRVFVPFPVTMRADPSIFTVSAATDFVAIQANGASSAVSVMGLNESSSNSALLSVTSASVTAGNGAMVRRNNTSGQAYFSAEL